jgi:hypothetical protein
MKRCRLQSGPKVQQPGRSSSFGSGSVGRHAQLHTCDINNLLLAWLLFCGLFDCSERPRLPAPPLASTPPTPSSASRPRAWG